MALECDGTQIDEDDTLLEVAQLQPSGNITELVLLVFGEQWRKAAEG